MTFVPPIIAPLVAPIATPGGAVVMPWYLLGGVTTAQCAAAYQPKGAADLAASYVNLAHPGTNDAAPGTAPTFAAATGWTFNGSSQYLITGILPSNTTSIIGRYSGLSKTDACLAGCYNTGTRTFFWVYPRDATNRYYGQGDGTATSGVGTYATSGVIGLAGKNTYWNGSPDVANVGGLTFTGTAQSLTIAVRQDPSGALSSYYGGNILALAIYNITLSSTQVGLISTAMELLSYTPVLSSVTALDAAITISWTGSWAAEGYSVERSLTGQNNWAVIGTTTNTYYTDSTVTTGVTYDYRMQGYNATI